MIQINELALDALQASYVEALNTKDMAKWLALFAQDPNASYICTTRENVRQDLPLALMMDDCYARLQDRVMYVTEVWAGTFQDYDTRHLTQRLSVEWVDDNVAKFVSNVVVHYTPEEVGVSQVLCVGQYHDVVDFSSGKPLFLHKKLILDTNVLPRYLVYPL